MADPTHRTSALNGHSAPAAEPSTTSPLASTSSQPPVDVDLRVLVVTPITAIVKELQSRLSALPAGVTVEVADSVSERHLEQQIAHCNVIFGEPKEIHDKLHVRSPTTNIQHRPEQEACQRLSTD